MARARWRGTLGPAAGALCLCLASCQPRATAARAGWRPAAEAMYLAARVVRVTPQLDAYARVEPAYTVTVSAPEAGVLRGLRATPGSRVRAGETLARLAGPGLAAELLRGEANLRSAQAQLQAAQKTLAVARQQLATHFGTRQAVHQAEGALAQAEGNAANARAALAAERELQTVTAPAAGTVLALNASSGELVAANQAVLTLQPAGALWLIATFYGGEIGRLRPGMSGSFTPSGGGAIQVRVARRFGTLAANGGETVALTAAGAAPAWLNGEYGSVSLNEAARNEVAVPTRALVLDRGRWWVVVHGARGDAPRAVTPGRATGWDTLIEHGLRAGEEVAVSNAYLLFHRAISRHFQLPD